MLSSACAGSLQGPNQRRLLHNLLRDYDKLDRPVTNDSQSLPVELHLSLMQIIDLVRHRLNTVDVCSAVFCGFADDLRVFFLPCRMKRTRF